MLYDVKDLQLLTLVVLRLSRKVLILRLQSVLYTLFQPVIRYHCKGIVVICINNSSIVDLSGYECIVYVIMWQTRLSVYISIVIVSCILGVLNDANDRNKINFISNTFYCQHLFLVCNL